MLDLKKKALGDVKGMLEKRMASRLAPKQAPVEEQAPMEGEESPAQEKAEYEEGGLEAKVPPGADLQALSPEEQQQLEELYQKMGC
jgi:hypothetical protein